MLNLVDQLRPVDKYLVASCMGASSNFKKKPVSAVWVVTVVCAFGDFFLWDTSRGPSCVMAQLAIPLPWLPLALAQSFIQP